VRAASRAWLADPEELEDAFQATFLVLARRAGSIQDPSRLGNWLFGVATKVAARARADARRRRERERQSAEAKGRFAWTDATERGRDAEMELLPAIQEELAHLPTTYRRAIAVCFFEGLTHEEAARRLSWPLGTVKGRLARAKELLRRRLERRGLVASVAVLTGILGRASRARVVPESLIQSTLKLLPLSSSASLLGAIGSSGSYAAVSLAQGVLSTMWMNSAARLTLALGLAGAVTTGAIVKSGQDPSPRSSAPSGEPVAAASVSEGRAEPATQGRRLMDDQEFRAFHRRYLELVRGFQQGKINGEQVADHSNRILKSQMDRELRGVKDDQDEQSIRIAAWQAHYGRLAQLRKLVDVMAEFGRGSKVDRLVIDQYLEQAESELAKLNALNADAPEREIRGGERSDPVSPGDLAPAEAVRTVAIEPASETVPTRASGEETDELPRPHSAPGEPVPVPSESVGNVPPPREPTEAIPNVPGPQPEDVPAGEPASTPAERLPNLPPHTDAAATGEPAPREELPPPREIPTANITEDPATNVTTKDQSQPGDPALPVDSRFLELVGPEDSDPEQTGRILEALDKKISIPFSNETPLEDVIKYIQTSTMSPTLPEGIPIYVDPQSLAENEVTLQSPILIRLEGVKLKTTLRLLLRQHSLTYSVQEGLLIIHTPGRYRIHGEEAEEPVAVGEAPAGVPGGMGGFGGTGTGGLGGTGGGGGFRSIPVFDFSPRP
jgi:RNA polymerase sigma factor (sigma-70 family)